MRLRDWTRLGLAAAGLAVGPAATTQAADRSLAYVSSVESGSNIALLHADGTERLLVTADTDDIGNNSVDPAWSPDGRTLAFSRERLDRFGESRSDLWLMSPDGSQRRRLTSGAHSDIAPMFAPDGSRLAFSRVRDTRTGPVAWIYTVGLGGGLHRLTSGNVLDGEPAWSPDGRQIAFERARPSRRLPGRPRLMLLDLVSGAVTQLAADGGSPAWSPDGRTIVFTSRRDARRPELYAVAPDGSGERRLTRTRAAERDPAWSADGRALFYASEPAGLGDRDHEVFAARPDGSCPTQLTNGSADGTDPAWHPLMPTPRELTACSGVVPGATSPLLDTPLEPLRRIRGLRAFWLGETFQDLLIKRADPGVSSIELSYGDCALPAPARCGPPVEMLQVTACFEWTLLPGPRFRVERGVLVDDRGEFADVLTGGTSVLVSSVGTAEVRNAIAGLRPVTGRSRGLLPATALPRATIAAARRARRLHLRLRSTRLVAQRLGLPVDVARDMLALGRALRRVSRLRALDCAPTPPLDF